MALRFGAAIALVLGLLLVPTGRSAASGTGHAGRPPEASAHRVYTNTPCNHAPSKPHQARCLSVAITAADHVIRPDASAPPSAALGPADIQAAYHLPDGGQGQTVAIVDAYGDSNAEADLGVFRSYYGLAPCTTANGCFRKVDQNGGTSYPADNSGWAMETSLDLDAVSAACPACNILLVEGNTASFDDLSYAVDTAVALGARYVSNSYGAGDIDAGSYDVHYDHPGVAVVASSGDVGNVVNWPSSIPQVVSVGGTRLTKDTSVARGWDESAWTDGGSGCSAYEPKPVYQSANGLDTQCANRATADVSADADPYSGLATYDTVGQNGWLQVGGTSLASPLVAAMYALAGAPAPGTYPVTYLYDPAHAGGFFDVTQGSNGSCGTKLCQAGAGWDGPTGVGSPNGVSALVSGPHGDIAGQVLDTSTGAPIPGATVSVPQGYTTHTDTGGKYRLSLPTGSYDVTATEYGYAPATTTGVSVTEGQTTTADFALAPVPSSVVSGVVTDGSGHGWPLYAKITIDGYRNGPIFTDPYTGRYSVKLAQQGSYTFHVSPVYLPGYVTKTFSVSTGTSDSITRDAALAIDPSACSAPGYTWNGLSESFAGWTGTTAQDGWSVAGSGHTWEFDNPGYRTPPMVPDGQFAIADSNYYGHGRMDTTLTSPTVDLSGQSAPVVAFDTAYYGYPRGETAIVDLSLDGGRSWTSIWKQDTANALGHIQIAVPQAAGKPTARVRFHYTGTDAWWWGIDNVFVGTRTCVTVTGSLIQGVVADTAGSSLVGATVTSNDRPREYGITVATPDDPNTPDGYYWLFSSLTGPHPFTATDTGHAPSTSVVDVASDQLTRQDWTLVDG